jgi:hypothetical protein
LTPSRFTVLLTRFAIEALTELVTVLFNAGIW